MGKRHFAVYLLLTLVAMAFTASLAHWQYSRAKSKERMFQSYQKQQEKPEWKNDEFTAWLEQHHEQLTAKNDSNPNIYQKVQLQGQWLDKYTVYLDNRPMQGRVGFFVVTPFQLTGFHAPVVMVQRGWVARNFMNRTQLPSVQTPQGVVTVVGYLAAPPSQLLQLTPLFSKQKDEPVVAQFPSDIGFNRIVQNIDPKTYTRILRAQGEVLAQDLPILSIVQTGNASEGLLRQWASLNFGIDKHYAYMVQWLALTVMSGLLFVGLTWLKPYLQKRQNGKQTT